MKLLQLSQLHEINLFIKGGLGDGLSLTSGGGDGAA